MSQKRDDVISSLKLFVKCILMFACLLACAAGVVVAVVLVGRRFGHSLIF